MRPSGIPEWAEPFDPSVELNWGRPDFSRRLLREHLDQTHDGASRRLGVVTSHVRRLERLLPRPPARVLDAGCGPGLYATRLARLRYQVVGTDVSAAAIRHANREAARLRLEGRATFFEADLRTLDLPDQSFDAALLIYFLIEAFPRAEQPKVLRRLARVLRPGAALIAELRLRPDQPPGRTTWWDVVSESVLADRRHLLLGDARYEPRRHTYVLREVAVFDDGTVAAQQTSGWLCPYGSIPGLFSRGGFRVVRMYDGWTIDPASALSETVLVVARRFRAERAQRKTAQQEA
jgi:SAM-dependent methyltransferase